MLNQELLNRNLRACFRLHFALALSLGAAPAQSTVT